MKIIRIIFLIICLIGSILSVNLSEENSSSLRKELKQFTNETKKKTQRRGLNAAKNLAEKIEREKRIRPRRTQ